MGMRSRTPAAASIGWALALMLLSGCAQGGDGNGGGRRGDGTRDGGGMRDGGATGCAPRGYASTCQDATDLGMLAPGERIESEQGIGERGSAQWIRIAFPPAPPALPDGGGVPSMAGTGTPSVRFLRNDGDVYRFEIRSACVGVVSCGAEGGMATNLTEWTFTDDPALSAEGQGRFSTRDTPWPETIYVRVYPRGDPTCGRYQLEITR